MWMSVRLERLSVVSLHSVIILLGVTCASVSVASWEMEKAALVSQISLSIQYFLLHLCLASPFLES